MHYTFSITRKDPGCGGGVVVKPLASIVMGLESESGDTTIANIRYLIVRNHDINAIILKLK